MAPALIIGAAAPAYAALPTASCPTCLAGAAGGAFTASGVVADGVVVTLTGTAVMRLDSTACPSGLFDPAYAIADLGVTFQWSDGSNTPATVGTSTGAGTIGNIDALDTTYAVAGVTVGPPSGPAGTYTLADKHPTGVCFTFVTMFLTLSAPIINLSCAYTLCQTIDAPTVSTDISVLGVTSVTWSGTLGEGTLTPA
ncbi:MAG: hypothetical protein ACK5MP_11760 [Nostocoides sp.]